VSFIYKSEDGFQETKIVLDWPGHPPDFNTIQISVISNKISVTKIVLHDQADRAQR